MFSEDSDQPGQSDQSSSHTIRYTALDLCPNSTDWSGCGDAQADPSLH